MKRVLANARIIWGKVEATVLLIGIPAALLVWAYSNFATREAVAETKIQINDAKAELRSYVDDKHGQVTGELREIKEELGKQRNLQEKILLRVSH